jgi:hypothetical protein
VCLYTGLWGELFCRA